MSDVDIMINCSMCNHVVTLPISSALENHTINMRVRKISFTLQNGETFDYWVTADDPKKFHEIYLLVIKRLKEYIQQH